MNCLHIYREIDPILVPKFTLNNGSKMPCIGFSTNKSAEAAESLIQRVVRSGFRHFDCEPGLKNNIFIGKAIGKTLRSKIVNREQLWISSKVWFDMHGKVEDACRKALSDLQLEYLDLFLLHWPFIDIATTYYNHDHFMYSWRQMEKLVASGLVKNIGTSNLSIAHLGLLLQDAKIKPVCNQMEIHPNFQQVELFNFCKKNEIQPVASSPLGSLACEENEKCHFNPSILKDEIILKIARRLNATPCQIAIKWAIQRGQIPISTSFNHFYEHIEAVVKVNLTEQDMLAISNIDKSYRKSKYVFDKTLKNNKNN